MKLLRAILLVSILTRVEASPLNKAVTIDRRDDNVSQTQLDNFHYFAQYAAAGYCANNDDSSLGPISCVSELCPAITAANAMTICNFATGSPNSPDLFGFVATDPSRSLIVVVFRGSYSVRNFIADLDCDLVDTSICSSCQVHNGFNQAWLQRQSDIIDAVAVARAAYPSYGLVFTGHSLGASVATIAGAYFRSMGQNCDIYTYGSPRTGNAAFANYVSSTNQGSIYRITHLSDPVPHLPPGADVAWLTNYYHTTPEFWLSDGTYDTVDYGVDDIKMCGGINSQDCAGSVPAMELNILSHGFYFQAIASCDPGLTYK